jgi:hypothetical protein
LEALSQNCPVIASKSSVIPEMVPFVKTAYSESDLIEQMNKLSRSYRITNINVEQLKGLFNWDNYRKQLLKLL